MFEIRLGKKSIEKLNIYLNHHRNLFNDVHENTACKVFLNA